MYCGPISTHSRNWETLVGSLWNTSQPHQRLIQTADIYTPRRRKCCCDKRALARCYQVRVTELPVSVPAPGDVLLTVANSCVTNERGVYLASPDSRRAAARETEREEKSMRSDTLHLIPLSAPQPRRWGGAADLFPAATWAISFQLGPDSTYRTRSGQGPHERDPRAGRFKATRQVLKQGLLWMRSCTSRISIISEPLKELILNFSDSLLQLHNFLIDAEASCFLFKCHKHHQHRQQRFAAVGAAERCTVLCSPHFAIQDAVNGEQFYGNQSSSFRAFNCGGIRPLFDKPLLFVFGRLGWFHAHFEGKKKSCGVVIMPGILASAFVLVEMCFRTLISWLNE